MPDMLFSNTGEIAIKLFLRFLSFLMVVKPLQQPTQIQKSTFLNISKIVVFNCWEHLKNVSFHFIGKKPKTYFWTFWTFHNFGFWDYSYFPLFGVTRWGRFCDLFVIIWRWSVYPPSCPDPLPAAPYWFAPMANARTCYSVTCAWCLALLGRRAPNPLWKGYINGFHSIGVYPRPLTS